MYISVPETRISVSLKKDMSIIILDLVGAEAYWQPEAAKISHSTRRSGCGASYDAGTMPVAFIYVYGRYTGLGCHPNVQGRPLGSILESGTVFVMLFSGAVSNFANSLNCSPLLGGLIFIKLPEPCWQHFSIFPLRTAQK